MKITQRDINRRVRKDWVIDPITKIKKSIKNYNRNKAKEEFRKQIEVGNYE